MNSVSITGRITKDPELKTKQDGGGYCYFCIAVDAGKDKNGEKLTEFIDCIAYNQQASFISTYAKKGDMLELCGRLHTSLKEDSEGNKTKRVTVVAFNVGICSRANKEATPAAAPDTEPQPEPAKVEGKSLDEFKDPKGEWIWVQYDVDTNIGDFYCSACRYIPKDLKGRYKSYIQYSSMNYCPNCGADMRGANNG